jgi:hypothetical protein
VWVLSVLLTSSGVSPQRPSGQGHPQSDIKTRRSLIGAISSDRSSAARRLRRRVGRHGFGWPFKESYRSTNDRSWKNNRAGPIAPPTSEPLPVLNSSTVTAPM